MSRWGRGLQAAGLHAAARLLLALGARQPARRVFDRLLGMAPHDLHAWASRAHLRAQAGDSEGAIDDYRKMLAMAPAAGAPHWFNLGYLLQARGRLADAEDAFRRALRLDPALDRAWYGLGLVLASCGRHEEAVAALRRNVELQPLSPQGWEQLVRLHWARREHDEARRLLRQLRTFEPQVARRLEQQTGLRA